MSLAHASVSVLRTCLVQAVRGADALMQRLLQRTEYALEQALFTDFSSTSRDILGAALHNLQQHRAYLIKSYPQNLLEALVLSARQPFSFTAKSLDTDSLPLASLVSMAESANRQLKAEQRLLQMVAPQVELALADLDALMCGAQGLEAADPQCNPLRPENYVHALDQSLTAVQPAMEVAQCWRDLMGQQLGGILVSEYARTAALLRQHGVLPARYGVEPSADHQPQSLMTLRLLQELATDPRWIDDSCHTVPQSLTDSMLAGWPEQASLTTIQPDVIVGLQTGWSSYSSTALQTVSPSLMPSDLGQLSLPQPTQAPRALVQARTVQRMMAHMTGDTRLLPAVQRVLRQLEPTLIRLVEHDAAFFEDRQHPARQLLDELTARSLWFVSESALGFEHFIGVAETAASKLAGLAQINAQVFALALQFVREQWPPDHAFTPSLSSFAEAEHSTQQGLMSSALSLLDKPSARELIQAPPDTRSIALTIRNLPSAQGVPEDILDFVTGPWAEVIAHAQRRQKDGAERDPGGYLALVPSLLWSVSAQAAQDVGRLISLAPKLQRRLARGLTSVGRSDVEIAALAARIGSLQQRVLDMVEATARGPAASDGRKHAQISAGTRGGAAVAETPVASTALQVQAAPVQPRLPENLPVLTEVVHAAQPQVAVQMAPAPVAAKDDACAQWALGTWVELRSERQQLRTQLTWVSPQQSLFLFTAEDGSTQSMTRRMRDKLLAQGQLTRLAEI